MVALLIGLVRTKRSIKLTEIYRSAITKKHAKLEYGHIENNETWDLVEHVENNLAGWLWEGFER